ncbi:MAG: hypothetical protein HYY64_04195 [Candidatus Rokubacteria bacterium]|nr:hypothetical protein [Candidatus Rokubacteria bacterium]
MRYGPLVARGAGLFVMGVLAWQTLQRGVTAAPPGVLLGILDGANLIFHEAGHVLFLVFGEFLQILGGSLMQILIPAACAVSFLLRRQPAAAAAGLFWTGESLTNVAIYVADARRLALPLLGGDGSIHDWNYLLGRLGLLNQADLLGWLVFTAGGLTILGAVVLLVADLLRTWTQTTVEE